VVPAAGLRWTKLLDQPSDLLQSQAFCFHERGPVHSVDQQAQHRLSGRTNSYVDVGADAVTLSAAGSTAVDRLLRHARLIVAKDDSHRLAGALAGQGVIPLDWPRPRNTTGRQPGILMATSGLSPGHPPGRPDGG
jgi:hypothetical protein